MKFTQTLANVVNSLIVTWMSLLALGYIPDTKWAHATSAVMAGAAAFMTNMGFNRTPNGTVLPDAAKKFVDANADVQLKIDHPPEWHE